MQLMLTEKLAEQGLRFNGTLQEVSIKHPVAIVIDFEGDEQKYIKFDAAAFVADANDRIQVRT